MTSTIQPAPESTSPANTDRREALGERILNGAIETAEMFSLYLGVELGLYQALADHGPMTFLSLKLLQQLKAQAPE